MFATLPDVSPCLIHFLLVRPSLQEIADVDLATLPRSSQPVVEEAPLHDLLYHVTVERRHVVLSEARVHPAADGLRVLTEEHTTIILGWCRNLAGGSRGSSSRAVPTL